MSLKIDRLQLEIIINNDQARKSLRALEDEAKQLKKDLRKVPEGSDEWKRIETRLKSIQVQHDKIIEKLGIEKLTMKELKKRAAELNRVMSNLDPTTVAYKKLATQLTAIKNRQAQLRASSTKTGTSLKKLAGSFNHYFGIVTAGIATMTGIFFSAKEWVKGLVGLDDQVANVMKTTSLTRKEVRELHSEFKYLNTRTPRKELMLLAEEAGRLGKKSKKDVMDFVEVANMIKVSLGDDLGEKAEEATKEIGKLTNIYKIGNKYGTDFKQSMLMVGSAINEVSANSQAQAPYLIETLKRMGGLAEQAGIMAQDVIGYGSALDQLGQRTEMSTTAMNKVILNMFTDTSTYAKIAQMSLEDFTSLLNTDANEAFLKLLEGLNGNNDGLSVMGSKLQDLGLDGSRAVQVLASLASNTEMIRTEQDLANKALLEATSLTNEYNLKNNNMAGNLDKVGRALRAVFINSSVNRAIEGTVETFAKWVKIPLADKLQTERNEVNLLAVQISNTNTPAQRRNEIYERLKQLSPDIVEGLDAENISVEKLKTNMQAYNEQMVKKILIARLTDQEQEAINRAAQKGADAYERELDIYNQILESNKDIAFSKEDMNGKIQKTIDYLISEGAEMDEVLKKTNITIDRQGIMRDSRSKEQVQLDKLMLLTSSRNIMLLEQKELENETSGLTKRLEIAQKMLGLSDNKLDSSGFVGPPPPPDYTPSVDSIKSLNAEIEILEKARLNIAETDKKGLAENEKQTRVLKKRVKELTISYKKLAIVKKEKYKPDTTESDYLAYQIDMRQRYREKDLQDITEAYELETTLRETEHQKALAALGINKKARAKLDKKFKEEEAIRMVTHLEGLTDLLNEQLVEGGIDGLSIEDAMLSDDEKEALTTKIADLQLLIAQLQAEITGTTDDDPDSFGGVIAKYLLGDDWETMDLADKIQAVGELAIKTLNDINKIISNNENQQLLDFKNKTAKKKELLNKQLDDGAISYDEYTARTAQLDEDLDKKKRRIDHDQAVRAKALAILSAVLNTAAGVVRAFKDYAWPYSMAVAAIVGALGTVQIGVAASASVPSYATGNYQDILAQDGKKYRAKVANKNHKSGMYSEPTYVPGFGLFGETKDPELVFNPDDTSRILNSPGLIDAINHTLGVQSFAQGNASQVINEAPATSDSTTNTSQTEAMNRFADAVDILAEKGIKATWHMGEDFFNDFNQGNDEYNDFLNRVN